MTVREALRKGAACLMDAGVPDARLDAEYLLAELLHSNRLQLLAENDQPVPNENLETYSKWIARRSRREPLQYILGTQPFMGQLLSVSPAALIPRQDTEILCEEAIKHLKPGMRVLDLCTGTGALAIAMKAACPKAIITATDISEAAAALARENANRLGTDIHFVTGDLFAPLADACFDLIVSNPPYIPHNELPGLQAEVLYEPVTALDGGDDGLDFYRRIAAEAPRHLNAGGCLLLEIGSDQAADVTGLLSDNAFTNIRVIRDLAGLDRVVAADKDQGQSA